MKDIKIVSLLNKDIAAEHAAIIQYLVHAYAIGEGEIACEIEAIAREEMRHLDWLAETVVELGGVPVIKRGKMRLSGKTVSTWFGNDVLAEEDAIAMYQEHIRIIDDSKIKRLLKRILSDEKTHHSNFKSFIKEASKEALKDLRKNRNDRLTEVVNWGIEHEYTVILQYLLQSYLSPNEDMKHQLEDQAVNEMQHLGWLAEKMVSKGGNPRIEHGSVDQAKKLEDMLNSDIKIEKEVAVKYGEVTKTLNDPKLKKLFTRMKDHELYHVQVFTDLKDTLKKTK